MIELPIAHWRSSDQTPQLLTEHLRGVGALAMTFAKKLNLQSAGELIGLLHDLGKYSKEFRQYIYSALGLTNSDEDDYVDASRLRGKVDHSTAGAQYIWHALANKGQSERIAAQMLGLCVASHHSGLIDCVGGGSAHFGENVFATRMGKSEAKAHLDEVAAVADHDILARCNEIMNSGTAAGEIGAAMTAIQRENSGDRATSRAVAVQQVGLLARFIFSCLIDADRIDTANFEHKRVQRFRPGGDYVVWPTLVERLEAHLKTLTPRHRIDHLRNDISQHCLVAAARPRGIYSLTVPTGGGKTLASLRFALHHAQHRKLDRIIYVVPFTSIIDQNAQVARNILEPKDVPADRGRVVLEHHSNLTPEQQTWREKILSENWDAPVVYTTMVQFLESLFGAGTRGARRMHQLANAVLIFDEVQALPIKCVHIFNNAINFLADQCNSTVVLCTATQPLLEQVAPDKGAIRFCADRELGPDVEQLFEQLKRVEVRDQRRPGGWSDEEVATLAADELRRAGSCLVVVNTKNAARAVFDRCSTLAPSKRLFHLSTDMCPAHRKRELARIKKRLGKTPVLCVSTQLIEAGVDVDFHVVIRYLAGLDSIVQAAGRCNRNGRSEPGIVHVVNPARENLDKLPDIRVGRDKAERVLDDFREDPARYQHNLFSPQPLDDYYRYYFFSRQNEMTYPVSVAEIGHSDTLFNMLSLNTDAVSDHVRTRGQAPDVSLRQAFKTAADAFKAIDAPTQGIVVPFGVKGRDLIAQMCAAFDIELEYKLLRRAQQFTVNVFPHVLDKLRAAGAVHEVKPDTRILCLEPRYYSPRFGVATEPVSLMGNLNV